MPWTSTGSAAAVASMGGGVVWLWAVPSRFGDCGARFEALPVGATTMASPRLVKVAGLHAAYGVETQQRKALKLVEKRALVKRA